MTEAAPVNHSEEGKKPTPQLGALVDSAWTLFRSKHTYIYEGNYFGYIAGEASADAITLSGFSSSALYSALTRETTLTPEDTFIDLPSERTW